MSTHTKHEVLAQLRSRNAHTGPPYKSKLTDQVVAVFGLHRKSAIRALRPARLDGPAWSAHAFVSRPFDLRLPASA
jgi:hypothetical protein